MEKHTEILDLPYNSPPYFGKALKYLAIESFGLTGSHSAVNTLADYLGIDRSNVRRWVRGELDNTRHGRLTEKHFRTIITFFWERQTLKSVDEVLSLARCAGENYALESQKAWFWELTGADKADFEPPPVRDERYPVPSVFIPRNRLWDQVLDKIVFCLNNQLPLVIYGEPGIGKTTFMENLENEWKNSFKLKHHFPDGVISAYLKGKSSETTLAYWLRKLAGNLNFASLGPAERQGLLRKKLRGKRLLLLIDDVDDPNYAHLLMQANPKTSLTIITTANPDVAMLLAPNKNSRIKLGGFTRKQTEDYYQKLTGETLLFPAKLEELREILSGNPLALFFAFKLLIEQKDNWDLVLKLLNQELCDYPDTIQNGVFLVQKIIYEKVLSPELQQHFRALGALYKFWRYNLEAFTALWNCSPDIARMILNELENRGGLVIQTGDDIWDIHGNVIGAAGFFLQKNTEELRFANGWTKRGLTSLEESLKAGGKQELIPWKDLLKLWSVRKRNYPIIYFAQEQDEDYFNYLDNKFWEIIKRNPNVFIYKDFMYAGILELENERRSWNRHSLQFWSAIILMWFMLIFFVLFRLFNKPILATLFFAPMAVQFALFLVYLIHTLIDNRYSLRQKLFVDESFLRYQGYNETEIKYLTSLTKLPPNIQKIYILRLRKLLSRSKPKSSRN